MPVKKKKLPQAIQKGSGNRAKPSSSPEESKTMPGLASSLKSIWTRTRQYLAPAGE